MAAGGGRRAIGQQLNGDDGNGRTTTIFQKDWRREGGCSRITHMKYKHHTTTHLRRHAIARKMMSKRDSLRSIGGERTRGTTEEMTSGRVMQLPEKERKNLPQSHRSPLSSTTSTLMVGFHVSQWRQGCCGGWRCRVIRVAATVSFKVRV